MKPSRLLCLALMLLGYTCPLSIKGQISQTDEQINRANQLIENGNSIEAAAVLNEVLIEDLAPEEVGELYLAFARIAHNESDNENLIYYLSKVDEVISQLRENESLQNRAGFLKLAISAYQNPQEGLNKWKEFIRTPSLDKNLYYKAVGNLGACYILVESYDSAIFYINKAIKSTQGKESKQLSNLYQNKAFALAQSGVTDSVLLLINESLRIAKNSESVELMVDGFGLLANHYLMKGEFDSAKIFLDSAANRLRIGGLTKSKYILAGFYYDYHLAKREYLQAMTWQTRKAALKDSLTGNQLELRLLLSESRRKLEQQENALTRNRNAFIVVAFGLALTLIILVLLIRLIRLKNRTTAKITEQYEEIRLINEELEQHNELVNKQNQFITRSREKLETYLRKIEEIANSSYLINGAMEKLLEFICLVVQQVMQVSRVSFWKYNSASDSITCQMLCIDNKTLQNSLTLTSTSYPKYFEALRSESQIVANDALTHPATLEFANGYFNVFDIRSMLDTSIALNGKLFGVICCEQTGEFRNWDAGEMIFMKSLSNFISIALLSIEIKKRNDLLADYNQTLEDTVKARTLELERQNEQLTEYAFINSHLLRAPLARILGISSLIVRQEGDNIDDKQLLDNLIKSSEELDAIITKISQVLYEGNDFTREDINSIINKRIFHQ